MTLDLIEVEVKPENTFTLDYYSSIIDTAKKDGYEFVTLQQYWDMKCPTDLKFILRHDIDANPLMLKGTLERETAANVVSSIFVRVNANTYNAFDYRTFPLFNEVRRRGHELGLHSNFLEFATFHEFAPFQILKAELTALRSFYPDIKSLACHRDLNFSYNSLLWLQVNWKIIKEHLGLDYHAYDDLIMQNSLYVNETAEQRLGWRNLTPEQAIATKRSICMLTHPQWWFTKNPFEV